MADERKQEIFKHDAPWKVYAMNWSQKKSNPFRLAIGSFVEEYTNKIQLVKLDTEAAKFTEIATVDHPYPATKIMWMPNADEYEKDLMATTGDYLRIWRVDESKEDGQKCKQEALLNNNKSSEFCAPLTSFDWCEQDPRLIGTSSIDTTCTIWDIEVGKRVGETAAAGGAAAATPDKVNGTVKTQLIAHDQEVYDIAFKPDTTNEFASVGADGSVRLFDLRDLKHSKIIHETENGKALLRLAWNRQEKPCNYLAVLEMDTQTVTVLDTRVPMQPLATLKGHSNRINGLAWAPNSVCHLCTAGDDKKAHIWDIANANGTDHFEPVLAYDAGGEVNQIHWSSCEPDWISICYDQSLEVLRV